MREIRQSGLEGGVASSAIPTPIKLLLSDGLRLPKPPFNRPFGTRRFRSATRRSSAELLSLCPSGTKRQRETAIAHSTENSEEPSSWAEYDCV
jgi:hypothetical protein